MRFMGRMGDASNPFNIPGLPGYDPSKAPGTITPAPGSPGVPASPSLPPLPSTGSGMDPIVKAQFIAAVPGLSAAQQQDLYDIGMATAQATTGTYLRVGGGVAIGVAVGWLASRMMKRRK